MPNFLKLISRGAISGSDVGGNRVLLTHDYTKGAIFTAVEAPVPFHRIVIYFRI